MENIELISFSQGNQYIRWRNVLEQTSLNVTDPFPRPLQNVEQTISDVTGSSSPSCDEAYSLMTVDQVQKALKRSRASIYRYANTEAGDLNPPIDPKRLNPEPRSSKDEPLLFALSEVERFAKYVLGIRGITIEVQESPEYTNQELMKQILKELKAIRQLLEGQKNETRS